MHVHHGSDGHSHRPTRGFLSAALLATLVLVAAEFLGGYLGHSLALLSDAIHNLSDVPTIADLLDCGSLGGAPRGC